ncbi:MAG: methionyl-tRNA formyltransferase [Solobacterium sp.]|nr:methionyl-tRNA formyltransferase [Solobacterium sp.]
MENVRIVFIGTPVFATDILRTLVEENYNVVAVVSQPDKPSGRKHEIKPTPVHELADSFHIPVLQPEKLSKEYQNVLDYQPDLIVTCAYGQIVPETILKEPKYGCVNIHPSLLPKYRGGAPVHHAIWAGDKETGVCLMEMVKAMDAGKVYAKRIVQIDDDDTTETLNLKLRKVSCELLKEELPRYLNGELPGEAQDESGVVIARNISKEDEFVSFKNEEINVLYNHIRACIDWPISYGMIEGKRMKFYKVRKEVINHTYQEGTILGLKDHALEIAAKNGILKVYELQLEGKNKMDADAFMNGLGRSYIGKVFE